MADGIEGLSPPLQAAYGPTRSTFCCHIQQKVERMKVRAAGRARGARATQNPPPKPGGPRTDG